MSARGAAGPQPRPLGELLIARGLLSQEQLAIALAEQEQTGRPLGEILVAGGLVSAPEMAQALATQRGGMAKSESGFLPRPVPALPPRFPPAQVPTSPLRLVGPLDATPAVQALEREVDRELAAAQDELQSLRAQRDSRQRELADAREEIAGLRVQVEARPHEGVEVESLQRELASAREELQTMRQRVESHALASAHQLESRRHGGAELEAAERIAELEAALAGRDTPAAPEREVPYFVFATVDGAYELIETAGALPAAGEAIEVLGGTHHVLRLGPSPLAGSARTCVYTIPAGSSPTGDSPGSERRETASHGNQS